MLTEISRTKCLQRSTGPLCSFKDITSFYSTRGQALVQVELLNKNDRVFIR